MSAWIDIQDALPESRLGYLSDPVLVQTKEFGFTPSLAVARCCKLSGGEVKWYLDMEFYHIYDPRPIAETVGYWQPMPDLQEEDER